MQFIKFAQEDREYAGTSTEVAVNVAHIVKIEPVWYEEDEAGKRRRVKVDQPGEKEILRGVQKYFEVYDQFRNKYHSQTASKHAQEQLEKLWNAAW